MGSHESARLKREIDEYVERVWPEVLEDIGSLVAIRSVEDLSAAREGAPWGPGPREALDEALAIACRLGLAAHDCDGYLGYADVAGDSDAQLAMIAHVDVVPEGPGWHTDPFEITRREGGLLGRGTIDNKGPAVLALHAARFVAERAEAAGARPRHTLRVLLGANEETSMGDVDWYLKHYDQPTFLFTPDAEFPVCCGEKGNYSGTFTSGPVAGDAEGAVIAELYGGTPSNSIPSLATSLVRAPSSSLPAAERVDVEDAGTDGAGRALARLTAHGIGGHASLPAGTLNAIGLLGAYLLDNGLCSEGERAFLELGQLVFAGTDGSGLGIACADEAFGALTCVGGTVRTSADGRLAQTIDCRYPTTTSAEAITARMRQLAAGHGCAYSVQRSMAPFYVDPKTPEIATLVRCYNEYTGKDTKPFTIGGGTYARHFARAASFGPEERDLPVPAWVGQMHGPDEGASEEQLKLALRIYAYSLTQLMELDL